VRRTGASNAGIESSKKTMGKFSTERPATIPFDRRHHPKVRWRRTGAGEKLPADLDPLALARLTFLRQSFVE
jgi:hypothetical protein